MIEMNKHKKYGIYSTAVNRRLVETLKEKAFDLIEFSPFEVQSIEPLEDKKKLFLDIGRLEWIIFTDIFSADFFIEELERNNIDIFELDEVRICSFGEAVADRLRFVQIHSDIIAQKIIEKDILNAIIKYNDQSENLNNLTVVKLKDEIGSLSAELENNNFSAIELVLGKCIIPPQNDLAKQKALLKGGAIDEMIFCSVEDVWQFRLQFGELRQYKDLIETFWGSDEITLKTLDEFGIKAFYFKK